MNKYFRLLAFAFLPLLAVSCSQDGPDIDNSLTTSDADMPDVSFTPSSWNGEKATDGSLDIVGVNSDIYHELTTFDKKITVTYSGNKAEVTSPETGITTFIDGAHVTIDFQSKNLSGVEIELKGASENGSLKVYGASKFMLTLNGVNLKSEIGPAINSQCKKRAFINIVDKTSNRLEDSNVYSDDPYYRPGSTSFIEDRKGCLFTEGDMIFSGKGTLEVKGNYRHGIATDGYFAMRPGTTIAVIDAVRNGVHAKGDVSDDIGVWMMGGLLYCNTSGEGGKAIKTDLNIRIDGGVLNLNTTGDSYFDDMENDTSSPACMKADADIFINGGKLNLCSTGKGGKGINAGRLFRMSGGELSVGCSGERFVAQNAVATSSSKGIKGTSGVEISGGTIKVASIGKSDGARAIESDFFITMSGGNIHAFAYDDALNAASVAVSGETILTANSEIDDALKGKEGVNIAGGDILLLGGNEGKAIDCDIPNGFNVTGGKVIALSGKESTAPVLTEGVKAHNWVNITGNKGKEMTVTFPDGEQFNFTMPRSYKRANLIVVI